PEATFRIKALVAPTTLELSSGLSKIQRNDLNHINETVTFDIVAMLLPQEMRCDCLQTGTTCTAQIANEHYVVEWKAGSVLAKKEIAAGIWEKKRGTSCEYEGWCKSGVRKDISGTEIL
ncbi:hypothetical protein EJ02DRAFT_306332, partial [Clathrospora elynae]